MEVLLIRILEYGTTPLLLILIFVVAYLVREIKKNGEADILRSGELKKTITVEITNIETKFEARLNKQDDRIKALEADTLKKDEFYRENSGWRSEINRLSDQMTTMTTSIMDKIIALWREEAKK